MASLQNIHNVRKAILTIILFCVSVITFAQDPAKFVYDKDLPDRSFHAERRDALRKMLPENSVAVFFANPIRNRSNDVDFDYHQDPNFYYFTGFTEPNSMIFIFKDQIDLKGEKTNEVMFVPNRDPASEQWYGRRFGKDGVQSILGINQVFLNTDYPIEGFDLKKMDKVLIIGIPQGMTDKKNDKAELNDMVEQFKFATNFPGPAVNTTLLKDLMQDLRGIKTDVEISLLRKAIDITVEAQIELIKNQKPGMKEYESQAIIEYVFKKNGAKHPGFPSIIGSGENSCILHYNHGRRETGPNDLLVCDVGAEYHGYTADVTRTFPVNGKFSPEQRNIYEIVLRAQEAGITACKPGVSFYEPHRIATEIIAQGLFDLGILKDKDEVRKYFMHGTSHHLGLDVHDLGRKGDLKAGMVITVEPGIYISEGSDCDPKWWNIGVRIEDDILILATGYENLSIRAPRSISVIETMMSKSNMNIKGK